jgi:hypothetical protein
MNDEDFLLTGSVEKRTGRKLSNSSFKNLKFLQRSGETNFNSMRESSNSVKFSHKLSMTSIKLEPKTTVKVE